MRRLALIAALILLAVPQARAAVNGVSADHSKGVVLLGSPAGAANCKAATTGAIRYNSTTPRIEFCNGTVWAAVGTVTPAGSDTQIQWNNNGVLAASSGLVFNSTSGNVGIGTTTPAAKLDVYSSAGIGVIDLGGVNGISYPSTDSTAGGSIAIGNGALAEEPSLASTAFSNTAVGYQTLNSASMTTAAVYNTAVGYQALKANTTGNSNIANGYQALTANTTGSDNIAIGYQALVTNTTAINSTAIGAQALDKNNGNNNNAIGNQALYSNTSGISNVAFGNRTLYTNTTGQYNTAVGGYSTIYTNSTGSNNTAVGYDALYSTTVSDNTAFGYYAGYDISTGSQNLILGYYPTTGVGITSGSNNILLGYDVRPPSQTASNQLNIGNLIYATGLGSGATLSTGSVGIGTASPGALLEVHGKDALINNLTVGQGGGNILNNTAVGIEALASNSGGLNTAFGSYALPNNTTGNNNTAIGLDAIRFASTGTYNTAVGVEALDASTMHGSYNVAVGPYTLGSLTSGQANVALGQRAGNDVTSGNENILIGYYATLGVGVTTGSNNILLGYDVRPPSQTASNQLNIGNLIYATGLGSSATLSTGHVGIGTTSPFAFLDVAGAIRISDAGASCNSSSNGAIRFNSITHLVQYCYSLTWSNVASATATPAGSDKQIQLNNNGVLYASSG